MKVGNRTLSFKKCIATRTSWRRYARQSIGLKVPRGYGCGLPLPRKHFTIILIARTKGVG